jgi:hypothetical protein
MSELRKLVDSQRAQELFVPRKMDAPILYDWRFGIVVQISTLESLGRDWNNEFPAIISRFVPSLYAVLPLVFHDAIDSCLTQVTPPPT